MASILSGQTTLATGSVAQPISTTQATVKQIHLRVDTGAAGPVYIGDSSVTILTGYSVPVGGELVLEAPGGVLLSLANVYFISATTGDKVLWIAVSVE